MSKIDDLIKQKQELEKEIEQELKSQTKLGEDDLKTMGRAFAELIFVKYLEFKNGKKPLDETIFVDGEYNEKENTFTINAENQTKGKKILTVILKGE